MGHIKTDIQTKYVKTEQNVRTKKNYSGEEYA